jgi:hypothetical protein
VLKAQSRSIRGRWCGDVCFQPIGYSIHEAARVQQMLRPVMTLGPTAARFELNAKKISDFAKYTIFYCADKLTARMTNTEVALQRHGPLHLEAGSR